MVSESHTHYLTCEIDQTLIRVHLRPAGATRSTRRYLRCENIVMAAKESFDAVVIGAGVVGLAAARALSGAGKKVLILEMGAAIGKGTSSR